MTADFTYAHRCSNRAVEFIEKNKNEDYFLVVSYDEPHHPFICPKPFSEMYKDMPLIKFSNEKDNLTDKPIHQQAWSEYTKENYDFSREEFFQLFFGCNAFVDDEIGRVLDVVEKDAEDALVIYTSDHGEMMFAHGLNKKGPAMYEEITNIPLIVRHPGIIPANSASDALISLVDITPTILEYFDAEIPPVISGKV